MYNLEPLDFSDFVGNEELVQEIGNMICKKILQSMIIYGPNGCGKTALANIILKKSGLKGYKINAAASGVEEVKTIVSSAKKFNEKIMLIVDEIHHFSKQQQDVLIPAIDDGNVVLVGITTQNPFFYVLSGLLSRCLVLQMKAPNEEAMKVILNKYLSKIGLKLSDKERVIKFAAGDVRKLINTVNFIYANSDLPIEKVLKDKFYQVYIKDDAHYDMISAFIKSVRGSDPNSAVYWLKRLLISGEDPRFIARRLVILSAEDIGLAYPEAFNVAVNTYLAVERIGLPESDIILAFTTIYLSLLPKSNSSYLAIKKAEDVIKSGQLQKVPEYLKQFNIENLTGGSNYLYPHDYGGFVKQNYMEKPIIFYVPNDVGMESNFRKKVFDLWRELYEKEFKGKNKNFNKKEKD
ncbi:MAG: AAA family ATPase [bacterium]|nr:AAA family ATPase [bacterium]